MYRVVDRDGNSVELDDDEVVRDGQVLRVPMTFMDATQRSMAQADEQRQRVLDAYAAFNQKPLTSPRKCRRSVKPNPRSALGMR
jgi:hypothetical protein